MILFAGVLAATAANALESRPRRPALAVRGGSTTALRRVIATRPLTGTVAIMCIYVCIELCGLPSTPLCFALGLSYPVAPALGLAVTCSLVSAILAFRIGRTKLRPRFADRIETTPKLRAIDAAIHDHDFATILLLRLVPMPPAMNYVYGATSASLRGYAAATLVGNMPGSLMCILSAKGAALSFNSWRSFAVAGAVVALAVYGTTIAGRAVHRKLEFYSN